MHERKSRPGELLTVPQARLATFVGEPERKIFTASRRLIFGGCDSLNRPEKCLEPAGASSSVLLCGSCGTWESCAQTSQRTSQRLAFITTMVQVRIQLINANDKVPNCRCFNHQLVTGEKTVNRWSMASRHHSWIRIQSSVSPRLKEPNVAQSAKTS